MIPESVSYPIFVNDSVTHSLSQNVTFTAVEWAKITSQFGTALSQAMTVGIILGFGVALVAVFAALWWRSRNDY
jgi:hypothetical protein